MDAERGRGGRPRSEHARTAVLNAVDDLLVEDGYAAMTMKGIAVRAGVSRQTLYRWWSTKAEILFEASAADAREELAVAPARSAILELTAYLEALVRFLGQSHAGAAYRALVGEAQHDSEVARLIASQDFVGESARTVIERTIGSAALTVPIDQATAQLVGPTLFWILSGRAANELSAHRFAQDFLDLQRTASSQSPDPSH